MNAGRHAYVVNNYPDSVDMTGTYAYGSHNMAVFPFADVDPMHSPAFDRGEFATLRTSQSTARIGNWVSTWRRELPEGDLTPGVLVYARESGLVSAAETRRLREEVIATVVGLIKREGVETRLLDQWRQCYAAVDRGSRLESVAVESLLSGMETVTRFHLVSERLK